MKAIKKLLALVLAVCMLIGMPLSIDVSAMNSSNALTKLELIHVIPYIADSRWSNVAADSNHASYLMLYFNSLTSNTGAVASDILVVDKNGAIIRDENNKEVVLLGSIQGGLLPQGNAPLGWKLNAGQSFSGKTINNFYDVRDLLASEYYVAKGAKMIFRAWENNSALTGYSDNNGFINTYSCAHDANIKWTAAETLVIGNGNRDGIKKEISWNQFTFNKAQVIGDNKVRLSFSEEISNNAGKNNIYVALRIVDQNYALKYVDGSPKQWAQTSWAYASGELVSTFGVSIQSVFDECAKLNAAENTDKYMVTLCLEEKNLSGAHGEIAGSGFVDTLWGKTSGAPLASATVPTNKTTFDGAYCKLSTVDDLKKNSFQIESANVVSRANQADRVVVTFTEPVASIPVGSYVRIFDKSDALVRHDKTTMKVINTESGHLQWGVSGWTKASADGKKWIGNLSTSYGANTVAGIAAYAAQITDAAGKAVTIENGYKIQMSFLDQGTHTNWNGLIDNFKSTTGKALWAANVQNSGEERAVCNFSNALQITGVDLYNNNQVVITFNKDIDINKALTAINTTGVPSLWISGAEEIMSASDPICPNRDGSGHIQSRIANAQKFGNANNKLLLTGGDWNAILAKLDAYNAKWGVNAYPILHMQGGKADGIIPGFVGTDGSVLYNSCPLANDGYDGWAGRHKTPVTNISLGVTVTNVTANSLNNSLTVEFSQPVKYNDVKNSSGGSRTQVALAKFYIADDGKLNLVEAGNTNIPEAYRKLADGTNGISQPYETSYQASDANGAKVNTEYSKYWTFYFDEGVVDSAVAYYAEGNTNYDPHIGYGFAIYEDSAGDGNGNYGTKLTLGTHLEDFVTAPDADGMRLYLKSNSTHWGQRYFKAPTVADTIVKALSAEVISAKEIKVTFSEPVKEMHPNLWVSLRVTPGDNYLIMKPDNSDVNADYQMGGNAVNTFVAVNPDANGYSAEWIFNAPSDIIAWAKAKFFDDTLYADVANRDLTFSIEGIGGYKADGILPNLQNKDGMSVLASKYDRRIDGLYMSIKNDPAFDEGAVALYNGASYTSVEAAVEAAKTNGGTVTMIRDDVFTGQNGISVAATVVLDLAGKTLDLGTGSLVGNGHVIDSTNGNGLVKIEYLEENQTANFVTNNPQLPLYDSAKGGYRLFNTKVNALGTKDKTDDACKYGFNVTFDNEEAYALFADVTHNDTTVSFKLETERLDESKKVVPLSEDAPTTYVNNKNAEPTKTWAFTLKITGLAALNGDALTVSGMLYSAGVTMDVEIPVS